MKTAFTKAKGVAAAQEFGEAMARSSKSMANTVTVLSAAQKFKRGLSKGNGEGQLATPSIAASEAEDLAKTPVAKAEKTPRGKDEPKLRFQADSVLDMTVAKAKVLDDAEASKELTGYAAVVATATAPGPEPPAAARAAAATTPADMASPARTVAAAPPPISAGGEDGMEEISLERPTGEPASLSPAVAAAHAAAGSQPGTPLSGTRATARLFQGPVGDVALRLGNPDVEEIALPSEPRDEDQAAFAAAEAEKGGGVRAGPQL